MNDGEKTLEDVMRGVDLAGVPRSVTPVPPTQKPRAHESEAELERRILRMVGHMQRTPEGRDILIWKQEVGTGYTANVRFALREALAPFGPEVQRAAEQALMRHRITWGHVGQPDVMGSVGGRFFSDELKTEVGRLSPEQEEWHRAARERRAFVGVSRSVDQFLDAMERCRRGELE